MNIEEMLDKKAKAEVRLAITDYMKNEVHDVCYDAAEKYAKEWIKENEDYIRQEVAKKMMKALK